MRRPNLGPECQSQAFRAVAFSIYDLDNTNYIEPYEVQRFLAALLKENPSIRLEDSQIDEIVQQVNTRIFLLHLVGCKQYCSYQYYTWENAQ